MKIVYEDLITFLEENPSVSELSENLFQLGHEHEIDGDIFDFEFTPNRGDCLSLLGLSRDLNIFHNSKYPFEIYEKEINEIELDFKNLAPDLCPNIAFLEIEIDGTIDPYKDYLESYFVDLGLGKNNFFTDISNYLSYEMGQPTHCYDKSKMGDLLTFEEVIVDEDFETVVGQKIKLSGKNCVFKSDNKIINLAGVMGGRSTSCSNDTKKVLIECAEFCSESIIGKSLKYNLNSDASYKFERGVDPSNQEKVLRRFAKIVSDHTKIKSLKMCIFKSQDFKKKQLDYDLSKINSILGIQITDSEFKKYLMKLGFEFQENIKVPFFRNDIFNQNDLAEEIARLIGYNSISESQINLAPVKANLRKREDSNFKELMKEHGFSEIISFPFSDENNKNSIEVDNPLDINKSYLRSNLKKSLLDKLLYNERRQKDIVKLYEISDIYTKSESTVKKEKMIGIIASGRVGHNYKDFSKKISEKFLNSIFSPLFLDTNLRFEKIPRDNLDTKIKNEIFYIEKPFKELSKKAFASSKKNINSLKIDRYESISDFPQSNRDFSFSISNTNSYEDFLVNIENLSGEYLVDSFIFDFYKNQKNEEIKIGVRMIFQSKIKTLSDKEINKSVERILKPILDLDGVKIPGL